jgi:hypothetical protein
VETGPASSTSPPARAAIAEEATEIHTRILRLALGTEDSRRYWEHVDPRTPVVERALLAFEQRWFGAKSLERTRYLLAGFFVRYDVYPGALDALRRWRSMDLVTRQAICHWHLQLSDPLYRRFTGEFLVARRGPNGRVDRATVIRWLRAEYAERWSEATLAQFASKLLSAALEAGLVSRRDPRSVPVPKVPDHALAYLLYLLRETRFQGALTDNPYLRSMGIDDDLLAMRARALPGVAMRRMMGLVEFDWQYPDLATWARETVS